MVELCHKTDYCASNAVFAKKLIITAARTRSLSPKSSSLRSIALVVRRALPTKRQRLLGNLLFSLSKNPFQKKGFFVMVGKSCGGARRWAYSFNGKTSHSKREVPGSSPGGPAKTTSERSERLCFCRVRLVAERAAPQTLQSMYFVI